MGTSPDARRSGDRTQPAASPARHTERPPVDGALGEAISYRDDDGGVVAQAEMAAPNLNILVTSRSGQH